MKNDLQWKIKNIVNMWLIPLDRDTYVKYTNRIDSKKKDLKKQTQKQI